MARAGRKDRGLLQRTDATGKPMWYVRLYYQGRERRFGKFPNKTAAREFYEKAKHEQTQGRFFPERYQHGGFELMETLLDRYVANLTDKRRRTIADETYYAGWWKARLKGKRANQVTAQVVDEAKRHLTAEGYAAQTIVHYLKFLRHVLYAMIGKGKLPENPFDSVVLPKLRPTRTRFLSSEEEHALMDAIGIRYAPWVRLAILTGLRRSEQFGLRWSDVDLDLGLLTLPMTKSGGCQYVHLNEEAKVILRGIAAVREAHVDGDTTPRSPWVFPSENLDSHLDVSNFYGRVFMPAVRAAKLEDVTWHTLRHTFASRLAMNGATDSTIAALLRHSGTALVARYAHLSPSHLKSAVESVSSFGTRSQSKPVTVLETAQPAHIGSPTVTGTGNAMPRLNGERAEVIESVGRGERI